LAEGLNDPKLAQRLAANVQWPIVQRLECNWWRMYEPHAEGRITNRRSKSSAGRDGARFVARI